jgi:type I restriction-modification system DNA methylase subunit
MNITQIENNLKLLIENIDKETFIYNLLESYYFPKASISRLQKGILNLSKVQGEVSWKKKLFFKEELNKDLHLAISALKNEIKHNQRFIIVTDYETLLAIDTLTHDQLDIPITDLPKYYDFFLPWAGMEKATHAAENPADVKAAEKMAKLFDEIKKDNPDTSAEFIHNLNIFFSRLLFCYFAEDTNIFEDNQFSHAVESHTSSDGSDLDAYLNRLFWVLNTPVDKRGDIPHFLNAFPYVNGGLFKEEIPCPKFTSKSRQLLIDSGDSNDWSAINPDIFGSMFQAVISPEHRGGLGAHYTSVPNIMKVIEPLFLNDLKEEFENANEKKLKESLHRISKIKLFDPACGSGNFLIIAYKELRRLEMEILKKLGGLAFSGIHLNNFYGIELDDFAHEIAKLSLWLAEHQMNVEFFNEFGRTNPTLPLQEAGQIVCGNACRLDWEKVCPKNEGDEIYIFGNPPYLGSSVQDSVQKDDMRIVLKYLKSYKNLDYISCWFYKASQFIENYNSSFAFVSTNSICQGEQVGLLWPNIYSLNLTIHFAYTSFKWRNNAKQNAGVSVIIVGVKNKKDVSNKYLFVENQKILVSNINSYLLPSMEVLIHKRSKSISSLPNMTYGNKAVYGEPLILEENDKTRIVTEFPDSDKLFKKFLGAKELMDNTYRWVLWLNDTNLNKAQSIPEIKDRIEEVKRLRLESRDQGARILGNSPHQFRDILQTRSSSIVIPLTTSEKRRYIPIDFRGVDTILSNAMSVIYDTDPWLFSVLNSQMHMVWVKITSGKLEDRIR